MPLRDVARCVIAVLVTGMSLQDVIDVLVTGMSLQDVIDASWHPPCGCLQAWIFA
jgi:hypothetical protein